MSEGTKNRAFSLVELLVVLTIITILAGLLMSALQVARTKALEISAINDVRQLALGIAMHKQSRPTLPASSADAAEEDVDALLQALGGSASGIRLDPWGNEYVYIRSDRYGDPGAVCIKDKNGEPYNPDTFQLYSKGADGRRDPNASDKSNADNIWVDVTRGRIVRFSAIQEGS